MSARSLEYWARDGGALSRLLTACERVRGRVAGVLRQIIGAPDYERYLTHATRCHCELEPLTRDEFYRARLEDRYSKPGARCC